MIIGRIAVRQIPRHRRHVPNLRIGDHVCRIHNDGILGVN
jgi:hypothetical protein